MKTQGTHKVGSTEPPAPSLGNTEGVNEEKIRSRAYELYVERGMTDGHAEEDWLEAERQIGRATESETVQRAAA